MVELMTVEEVAQHLRVTKKTIYRLLKQGKTLATKVNQQWRFNSASIDRWLESNSVGGKATILVIDGQEENTEPGILKKSRNAKV